MGGINWNFVSSPNPSSFYDVLYGATAISATNVWAVGYSVTSNAGATPTHALIEHWDGTSRKVVSHPNPGSIYNYLNEVTAISTTNVWVVGSYLSSGSLQTLTERWNGKKWSVIPSPNIGTQNSSFIGTARVPGTKQLWAIGNPLAYWDGTSWQIVSSPNPGLEHGLDGITAVSVNDAWAVGDYLPNGSNSFQTLIEHWDGTSWSVVPRPSVGTNSNFLKGVTRVPGTNQVWAAGYYSAGSYTQTLIEFYC